MSKFPLEQKLMILAQAKAIQESALETRDPVEVARQQAEDEGLWFVAQTAPEAYLQQELRKLHSAVEVDSLRKVQVLVRFIRKVENIIIETDIPADKRRYMRQRVRKLLGSSMIVTFQNR